MNVEEFIFETVEGVMEWDIPLALKAPFMLWPVIAIILLVPVGILDLLVWAVTGGRRRIFR